MATITKTSLQGSGSAAVTITTLGASDTFVYSPGDVMIINNVSVGALTPNLLGDAVTSVQVAGVGSVSTSAGYTTPSIGAGAYVRIPLDSINKYLTGTVTLTGGDTAEVAILSV